MTDFSEQPTRNDLPKASDLLEASPATVAGLPPDLAAAPEGSGPADNGWLAWPNSAREEEYFESRTALLSHPPRQAAGHSVLGAENLTPEHQGRYTTRGEFRRGGIGRILLAFDSHLGREVAVKELLHKPELAGSGSTPGTGTYELEAFRFLREARITGRLEHPGVVPVYELGRRLDGTVYYTMKLVRGTTLADRLAEAESLRERMELLHHFVDICQTMAYAHARGVIHRDLKPANVMIGEFGETVVLDWGLAKVQKRREAEDDAPADPGPDGVWDQAVDTKTQVGAILGTPVFMSPEQMAGKVDEMDERSDVWSLGVILYKILTGEVPFQGNTIAQLFLNIQAGKYRPVGEVCPDAPAELASVVDKCLRTDPAQRFPHAGDLASEISRFMAGKLVSVYTYSFWRLVRRWFRLHRAVSCTVLACLLILGVGAVWSHLRISEQRDRALSARALAERREWEMRAGLAGALVENGRKAAADARWAEARIFFAGALTTLDREDARLYLMWEAQQPLRLENSRILGKHRGHVVAADVSADGRLGASGAYDGAVSVWDMNTLQPVAQPTPLGAWVSALAFSPDGTSLAMADADGTLRLVDARTSALHWESRLSDHLRCLRFSPDGAYLVMGGRRGKSGFFAVVDAHSGKTIALDTSHRGRVAAVDVHPAGGEFVTASEDGTVKAWSLPQGKLLRTYPGTRGWVSAVRYSPGGEILATGGSVRYIQLYSVVDGKDLGRLEGHSGEVFSLRFRPDGAQLVSAGLDTAIRIWSVSRQHCLITLTGHQGGVFNAIPVGDPLRVFSGANDGTVRLWTLRQNPLPEVAFPKVPGQTGEVSFVRRTPDGQSFLVALMSGAAYRIDARSGAIQKNYSPNEQSFMMTASRDGRWIALGSRDGIVRLQDARSGEVLTRTEFRDELMGLAFSPDGATLAVSTDNGLALLENLPEGKVRPLVENVRQPVAPLFSRDGRQLVALGGHPYFRIFDLPSGKLRTSLPSIESTPMAVTFSPDGSVLALASDDQKVSFFHYPDLQRESELRSQTGEVIGIDFSPNGDRLVTTSYDGSIKLFSTRNGECLLEMRPDSLTLFCAAEFSPDGREIVWGSPCSSVRWFRFGEDPIPQGPAKLLEESQRAAGWTLQQSRLIPR